ncbi:hypothetical protein niasHS_012919 [Heterodera schachtii]|uniref:Uncharacterized protein n=1 Tax=Heterodera schachtii TaxID=97005 RepID=A0ABD2ICS1_HETSC
MAVLFNGNNFRLSCKSAGCRCCWMTFLCATILNIFFASNNAEGFIMLNGKQLEDMQNVLNTQPNWASKGVRMPANVAEESADFPRFTPIAKKAAATGVLNKFGGSGARNCFFSPVSCMLLHDVPKYKKLIESTPNGGWAPLHFI